MNKTDKIINWSQLSQHLSKTDNKGVVRSNNIPKKYKQQVTDLQNYIHHWLNDTKLYSKEQLLKEYEDDIRQKLFSLRDEVEDIRKKIHELVDKPI